MERAVRAATPVPQARKTERGFADQDRLFYVVAAAMMLIFTAGGFRRFYLHGRAPWGEMTHQIVPLIVLHGLAMSSWVILFFVQSVLILRGYRRVHMLVIGRVGAVLAPLMVIFGSVAAVLSARFRPEIYAPLGGPRAFLATMFMEMLAFGAFAGIGLAYRRRPEIHRPMMLLATIAISSASLGRFPYIEPFAFKPPLYVMGPALLFGALLFLLQWAMTKAANRWFFMGFAGITIASFLAVAIGSSTLWNRMLSAFVP
jgi:hypothetical protein